jgi:hypothetical protein
MIRRAIHRTAAVCLALAGHAQDPRPVPPVAVDPAVEARALRLLDAHAERCRDVRVLTATYVQRRTTKLAKEPLLSRGQFLFVREPGCVMFRASEPRVSIVRLTETVYEVHRPQKKQLERFVLEGPELARSLFAALRGDSKLLRTDFVVRSCVDDAAVPTQVRIELAPRAVALQARMQSLNITLQASDAALVAVAYRDGAGDLVEIELHDVRVNPEPAPPAVLEVTKDTTVVEHAPPAKQAR